jgi:hypothetical protein
MRKSRTVSEHSVADVRSLGLARAHSVHWLEKIQFDFQNVHPALGVDILSSEGVVRARICVLKCRGSASVLRCAICIVLIRGWGCLSLWPIHSAQVVASGSYALAPRNFGASVPEWITLTDGMELLLSVSVDFVSSRRRADTRRFDDDIGIVEVWCGVVWCGALCCAVLCCAVLCCAVLCCAVLCCAVLCCAVLWLYCCVVHWCTGVAGWCRVFCGMNGASLACWLFWYSRLM